jgi:D-alanyl-D-alanine carboxypeptidase
VYSGKTLPKFPALQIAVAVLATFFLVIAAAGQASANPKYASFVIDANSGKVLHNRYGDSPRYPASLTKMMTLYMLFEAMDQGKVSKSTRIRMSKHAASMQPSKLGIPAGNSLTAEDAIFALVTKSANDVAAAVGEHLGGTESRFAELMTAKARAIGMSKTTFRNASGLPNSSQVTTARDMATLGIALQEHFPRQFKYFSTTSFRFGKAQFRNHNRLLGRVRGVDGIKTGYTRASGFNLVTSVNDRGRSIVAVVMGGKSGASRNAHMQELLAANVSKGSERKRGPLVARAGGTRFQFQGTDVASLSPKDIPIPARPEREPSAPAAAAEPVILQEDPVVTAYAAEPVPRPSEPIDNVVTASTPSRSGWVIQIAALESQDEAVDFIRNAQDKAASVLGEREPFIEQFEKGGTLYHRARFAGFKSKSEAWGACKALKKYKYSCLAYDNS